MADWVRRICYPLFLPAIVLTVWVHAWSAKMEAGRARMAAPPHGVADGLAAPAVERWSPGYGLAAGDDDGFASAAEGE